MPAESLPKSLKTFHDIGFEEIEHTADCALHIFGKNLPELLTNAAIGMTSLIAFEPSSIPDDTKRHVELEAMDAESLLVEWLSELAYWAETEMLIFHRFELYNVTPNHLQAVIRGGHASGFKKHIKAVTYHNLEVIETEKGLEATVVFDV
jgi:SHS2 domain-containing protein